MDRTTTGSRRTCVGSNRTTSERRVYAQVTKREKKVKEVSPATFLSLVVVARVEGGLELP